MAQTVVEVLIPAWEIECCAPPPVIGERSSWHLEFIGVDDDLAGDAIWTVTHREDGTVRLDRDGFEALWNTHVVAPPPPGIRTVRGSLRGTVHGGIVPQDLPAVSGYVTRVRIVSTELAWDPHRERTLVHTPGSRTLRDVTESPRWFDGADGAGRRDTGVLIDLAV